MSFITKFSNQHNNTLAPKNLYLADGLPVIHTKEPHLTKHDAIKSIKVLEDARNYDETHNDMSKIYQDPKVHGAQVAVLDAVLGLGEVEFARLQEVLREYVDLLDLDEWVDVMIGGGSSIKKHKKEKRRKPTKIKRPTKRRRPTKKRTIKRRR